MILHENQQLIYYTRSKGFGWEQQSALVVGWYRRAPWSDVELAEQLSKLLKKYFPTKFPSKSTTIFELLENLGSAGRLVLEKWERERADKEHNSLFIEEEISL